MESSIFAFIWKYSKRQQILLLALTVLSFPLLYASLEIPKKIINNAIGSETSTIEVFGTTISQIEYLVILCILFLVAVLASGLAKMRINTMKGILSERLLRRLRFQLISRMMRFPAPYFRSTSQGELVSMITSEAEPMGGLMGDFLATPVFQFGQMATIVTFLFIQSVWFGLASIALIPLQAWLIPRLQRQINQLNKSRIQQVRHLSAEIAESAAGISDLRSNGGWRYWQARFSDRLGRLFTLRFRIYQKKFFMKFLNNMIGHLTPFFFYLVGGMLAIQGQITVGALVAALAAYKDLSAPWKELLDYYNQLQDMAVRWLVMTERFAPEGMIDEALFEGTPDEIPHLHGDIEFSNVTVRDQDGNVVLQDFDLTIPAGARVGVQSTSAVERAALAQLLTREILPSTGEIRIGGEPISRMHQAVLAARVGYAHSSPHLFDGTLGDNLLMPLRLRPHDATGTPSRFLAEARQAGNSVDPLDPDWLDPGLAGLEGKEEIRGWWFRLVEAMGIDDWMVQRAMSSRIDPDRFPGIAKAVVALRSEVEKRLKERGLDKFVYRFDPDSFNPAVPLGGNLLYALPARSISQSSLAADGRFIRMLHDHALADEATRIAKGVVETLRQTFGKDDTQHVLFRKLGMEEETYHRLVEIAGKARAKGSDALTEQERSLLLTVPFLLTAEEIGPGFPDRYKRRIVEFRQTHADEMRRAVGDLFIPIAPDVYGPRLTVLENALFGRVSIMAGAKSGEIANLVAEVASEAGLREKLAATIYDTPAGVGGSALPAVLQERAAFSRAAIKKPDLLILDTVLRSHDSQSRERTRARLGELLPDTTLIYMEDRIKRPEVYDMFLEIKNGRIDGAETTEAEDGTGSEDLRKKLRIIAAAPLFENLDSRNQRLLAFSAQWYRADAGDVIFSAGQPADAAYLCLDGRAELRFPGSGLDDAPVTQIEPGRLIGDLSIMTRQNRPMDLVAMVPSTFLRIGAEELMAVIESDGKVAMRMLETVAENLTGAAETIRRIRYGDRAGVPPQLPAPVESLGAA